jgi:DNA replication protein DnaC
MSNLAEPALAEAILDRIVHHSHRVALDGESLRKNTFIGGPHKP